VEKLQGVNHETHEKDEIHKKGKALEIVYKVEDERIVT